MSETEPIAAAKPKREAKVVQHFVPQEIKEKSALVIGDGAGTKLGEIENVKIRIDKLNAGGDELKALQQQELRASEDGKVRHHEVLFGGLPADEMRRKMAASRSSLAATAARQARGAVPFPRAEDALQSTLKRLAASHGEHAAMAVASGVARAFSS